MLTSLTYQCDHDSLADITPDEFETEFRSLVAADFPDADISIRFAAPSRVASVEIDGESADPASVAGDVRDYAERAFRRCCETV